MNLPLTLILFVFSNVFEEVVPDEGLGASFEIHYDEELLVCQQPVLGPSDSFVLILWVLEFGDGFSEDYSLELTTSDGTSCPFV